MPLERSAELLETVKGYLDENGRSMDDFGLDFRLSLQQVGPADWDAQLQSWTALGATQICVNTMYAGLEGLDGHLQALRQFAERYIK